MQDNNKFNVRVLGEHIVFPLDPEYRLRLWDNLKNSIHNICSDIEAVADIMDGNPWGFVKTEKDVSSDDFRATYDALCSMADKLEDYVDGLRLEAEAFEDEQHSDYLRELGLEPRTFDAFANKHDFIVACHPEWVAQFLRKKEISAEDTLNACTAFLLDWAQNRKKGPAGFWDYVPPDKRKAG